MSGTAAPPRHDDHLDHGVGGGHDSHGHDEHPAEGDGWVLVPLVAGLVIGLILAVVFGLASGAASVV